MHLTRKFLVLITFLFALASSAQTAPNRVLVLAGHLLEVKSGRTLDRQRR